MLSAFKNIYINTFRKVAAAERIIFGRSSVEPALKVALNERNHILDPLFTVKSHLMNLKKDKVTKEERFENKTGVSSSVFLSNRFSMVSFPKVFCSDLDELVTLAVHERGLDPFATTGLVGLDGGQGSLKVALTLVENSEDKENKRSKYSQVSLISKL